MKSFLQNNDIEMYCNIKKVNIDKLDNIVDKYNNIYHTTIKIKPVDVKSSTYIDSSW